MKQKGFTLVEMLLVLAILGILIAILMPSVIGVTREAKEKQAAADLRIVQAALSGYYIKYNNFPSHYGGWEVYLLNMRPRILEKRPKDPFDPDDSLYEYRYRAPQAASEIPTYVLWSVGFSQMESAQITGSDAVKHTPECIFVTNAATISPSP